MLMDYFRFWVMCMCCTDVSHAEFYDSKDEMVASYSNGRWISYGTKEENTRESELWAYMIGSA